MTNQIIDRGKQTGGYIYWLWWQSAMQLAKNVMLPVDFQWEFCPTAACETGH